MPSRLKSTLLKSGNSLANSCQPPLQHKAHKVLTLTCPIPVQCKANNYEFLTLTCALTNILHTLTSLSPLIPLKQG